MNPFLFTVIAEFLVTTLREIDSNKSKSLLETWLKFLHEAFTLFLESNRNGESLYVCHHLILSDKLVSHFPPTKSCLQFFTSRIGRSVFIAHERYDCCDCNDMDFNMEWVSRIRRRGLRSELEYWLENKLERLWSEKGEIKFIDFLLKEELFHPFPPDTSRKNRKGLMCLLLSDRVTRYIPSQLSKVGLKHLAQTIKRVLISEDDGALWDCILNDQVYNSKPQAERLEDLKEKIQQFI